MSVKDKTSENKLILEIDNGDLDKINKAMEKWAFKDYQSLLRFAISVFILSDDNSISMKMDGTQQTITPAPDFLKPSENK